MSERQRDVNFKSDLAALMHKHSVASIHGYYTETVDGRDTYHHRVIVEFRDKYGTDELELPWEFGPDDLD